MNNIFLIFKKKNRSDGFKKENDPLGCNSHFYAVLFQIPQRVFWIAFLHIRMQWGTFRSCSSTTHYWHHLSLLPWLSSWDSDTRDSWHVTVTARIKIEHPRGWFKVKGVVGVICKKWIFKVIDKFYILKHIISYIYLDNWYGFYWCAWTILC